MFKLSYYRKKRLTDLAISVVMLVFLALTLLPIGWMVYSSLKDSTDIAIGKVGLRREGIDILKIKPLDEQRLLVLSANGGIGEYQSSDLKKLNYVCHNTAASGYALDDNYIWISSANRGLLRVSRRNYEEVKTYPVKVARVDFNKVTNTYVKSDDKCVYMTIDYPGFDEVLVLNRTAEAFDRPRRGAKDELFPVTALATFEEYAGIDGEIFSELKTAGAVFLGTSSGRLYRFDRNANKVTVETRLPRGRLLVRWHNYVDMWQAVNFWKFLKNSLIICGFTMLFAMIFSTLAAYALSRFRFPGADLFSNAILATQMIPAIMYLIPIYIMFVQFTVMTNIPVKGTYPGIILIYSAFFIPFSIWILRGFFASIPKELEEAALIDGCSRFQVFLKIALPLAIPGIIATGIYIFLTAWDELMFAWVMTNADTMTIPVGIRLFVGNYQNRFDLMMAAATVATLPVVVLFFLLQKHIVKGLTAGAVKG